MESEGNFDGMRSKLINRVLSAAIRIDLLYKKRRVTADWDLSDIYLAAYPKSGVTWLCLILANILKDLHGDPRRIDFFSVHDYIPDLHANPQRIAQIPPPRIIKTHERFEDWNKRIAIKGRGLLFPRVIYLVRDGRDSMISSYHYMKALKQFSGSFDRFLLEQEQKGADWSHHVTKWVVDNATLDEREILVIRYEDLQRGPAALIRKLLDFVGIEANDRAIESAVHSASLEETRKREAQYGGGVRYADAGYTFARKEASRDNRNEIRAIADAYFHRHRREFELAGYPEIRSPAAQ